MLSEKSTPVVRTTLPAVGAAIGDITELFYAKLFEAHPELLRDLFNRGNQAAGTQRQALAGSIAAFATHLLEHPDTRPDAMLRRIAHKHASLGVAPAQYDVVHRHLFAAIVEVLGDAVTPEVAAAWDEVYWLMANALIALEEGLYAEQGCLAGGTWRDWEVVDRTEETGDVTSFLLRPVGEGARPLPFRAGQYVSVQVELADGARQIRQYSLVGATDAVVRQIGVKREPGGEVSNHLHDHVGIGDTLRVSAPFGDLVPTGDLADRPVLLASAGIGVTPMLSLLHELAGRDHQRPVLVVHGDRSPAHHALRAEQTALVGKLADGTATYFYEQQATATDRTGLVDLDDTEVPAGTVAYLCGPLPFMRAVRAQLLAKGVPAADIHYEVFGPDLWIAG
ncbi:globin domain-containing protein [Streptacidiphilus jiangxiensis]|uniref:nitric oxide dioxygenase n=1 Tax=Streptacidiphilus jiangxiensis TaxID=235985 RepID=A0A1H7LY20_STRJI|nr:globin domain-containing protein [Streptacidiphilus jiangxiensis]SEL03207.1 nitric oxide dioxygenase [Streptacidiphilus jiangxiensis]